MSGRSEGWMLADEFARGCRACGLDAGDGPVVVGVSGGCDSIVLAHLLRDAGFSLVVVHVNHGLRSGAVDDEAFVQAWCARRGIPFRVFRPGEKAPSSGVQAWARQKRYAFFLEAARDCGARTVAVAHHADDQLETILINLNRGTGLAGLVGMRSVRPILHGESVSLVRPMLGVSRSDMELLARQKGWEWRVDPSNEDDSYTRNAIRTEINELDPAARNAFRAAGILVAERMGGLREWIVRNLDAISDEHGLLLPFEDLDTLPGIWQDWVILEWVSRHAPHVPRRTSIAKEIAALRHVQVGRQARFGTVIVWRERFGLRISPGGHPPRPPEAALPLPRPGESCRVPFGDGLLVVERSAMDGSSGHDYADPMTFSNPDPNSVVIDGTTIGSSLTIRLWEPGDRFQPLGMQGSKKVKAHLTDRLVAPSIRDRIPVVLSKGKIVWVAGHAMDDGYRIGETTRDWVRLCWMEKRPTFD